MVLKEFSLEGKRALVTGSGRGIGRGIALTLAEAGADVALCARTARELEETAAQVRPWGHRCLAIPTDLTREAQVEALASRVVAEWGGIDILVCGGGGLIMKPLVAQPGVESRLGQFVPGFDQPFTLQDWYAQIDGNLTNVFLTLKAFVPHMIKQKKGRVILLSSMEAVKGIKYHAVYDATKGALTSFIRALALEWARYNITVNGIGPGYIRTGMTEWAHGDEKMTAIMLSSIPLRRFLQPREIGLLAVYLASEASDYVTGQAIYIEGGVMA